MSPKNIQQVTPFEGPDQITIGNGQGLPIDSSNYSKFASPLNPNVMKKIKHEIGIGRLSGVQWG